MEEKIMDLTPEVIETVATVDPVDPADNGIDIKTAGLIGLAAIVLGGAAYLGYKKYQHKNK